MSRTSSADTALEIAWRNPWFGQGFGTFLPEELILDNQVLLLLIDSGILGLGAFLALVVTCLLSGWRLAWPGVGPGDRPLGTYSDRAIGSSLAAGVAAGASTLMFFDGFSFAISAGVLFLVVGVTGAAWSIAHDEAVDVLATTPPRSGSAPDPPRHEEDR